MSNDLKMIAKYKEKEFNRLSNLTLNLMAEIKIGLITEGRAEGFNKTNIWPPSEIEINHLNSTLIELKNNTLTPEEKETLNEKE